MGQLEGTQRDGRGRPCREASSQGRLPGRVLFWPFRAAGTHQAKAEVQDVGPQGGKQQALEAAEAQWPWPGTSV